MARRTASLASGIALAVLAQVPGFCLAVVPKGGTSGALALGFRRDATRFGALPGVGTMSTGRKVKFPNLLELRGAVGGHQGGVNGHGMTSPLIDEAEIRAEIDVFGAFEPDLVLLPGQDPMCLDMDFLGSFDSHERGDEIVRPPSPASCYACGCGCLRFVWDALGLAAVGGSRLPLRDLL